MFLPSRCECTTPYIFVEFNTLNFKNAFTDTIWILSRYDPAQAYIVDPNQVELACSRLPLKLNWRSDRGVIVCSSRSFRLAPSGILTPYSCSSSSPVPPSTTPLVLHSSTSLVGLPDQHAHLNSFFVMTLALVNRVVPLVSASSSFASSSSWPLVDLAPPNQIFEPNRLPPIRSSSCPSW